MRKFAIHPLFLAFSLVLILTDKSLTLLYAVICCVLHECGHIRAAKTRGYRLQKIVMMPYGAMVTGGETLHPKDEIAISLWGPAVNLIIAAVLAAFWWIVPESYTYTKLFSMQNLSVGLFNLLPFYPLDMSRIMISVAKNKKKMLQYLRCLSFVASATFVVLFIISCIQHYNNYSLAVAAAMFVFGASEGVGQEVKMYQFNTSFLKDAAHPVEVKRFKVCKNLPLTRVLRLMSPSVSLEIEITDNSGNALATFSETELIRRASLAPPGADLNDLLMVEQLIKQSKKLSQKP